MKKILTYSAPAKIILSGEHAVVYGKPALAMAIDLRSYATIVETNEYSKDNHTLYISLVVEKYLKENKILYTKKPFNFFYKSNIPSGRGLGSSASITCASVASLLHYWTNEIQDKKIINDIAYIIEKKHHGNPSGVDNTVCTYGGMIFFRKEFQFLKTFSFFDFNIPNNISKNLFLIDTGKPKESTAEMVICVKKYYDENIEMVNLLFNEIENNTKEITISIKDKNFDSFKKCISKAQNLLEKIEIIGVNAKNIMNKLDKYGVWKITGAGGIDGGSGFAIFCMNNEDKFESDRKGFFEIIENEGISFLPLKQDKIGVRLEDIF